MIKNNKSVTIFCSAADVDREYIELAKRLSTELSIKGFDLIWGGSNTGLMRVFADVFQENGSKLFGYSVEHLKQHARKNSDEMFIAKNTSQRKEMMLENSKNIIVFPGGIGTLDEFLYSVECKKHGLIDADIYVLNYKNYYEDIKNQFIKMSELNFVDRELINKIYFYNEVDELVKKVVDEN